MRIDVLGVGFDNFTMEQAVAEAQRLLLSGGGRYVVTPNPEIVELCREDEALRAVVNAADLVLPDGIGIMYGAKMLGAPLRQRLPGVDFAGHLMEVMAREGQSLFLLGAKPGYAEQAAEQGAEFVTVFCGEDVSEEQAALAEEIFAQACPGAELSVLPGGQPVYYYIVSIE